MWSFRTSLNIFTLICGKTACCVNWFVLDATAACLHLMAASIPPRVQSEKPDPLDLQGKRVLLVFVETMDPLEDKESEDRLDHPAAQETKGTLEKTDPR